MGRKRTLADPCSSSPTCSKYARTSSTCSSASSPPSSKRHLEQTSSPAFSSSDPSASSPGSTCRNSSDPFPRYSLGIPHLDVLLPFRDGLDLLHAYHQGIGWIYTPVDRTTLLETLEEAERHGADSIHPHRLACLLAALALGDLFSPCFSTPATPSASSSDSLADSPAKRGRIWFGVASACLAGSRKRAELMHNPTPDACSALYLMSTYLLCSNDEELFHRSQGLTWLALVLAKAALMPSCVASDQTRPTSHMAAPSVASQHQAAADTLSAAAAPRSPASAIATTATNQDRLHCTRLLSDLIFHLRCQVLTFTLPCTFRQSASPDSSAPLASFPDVPTIQAIWTAFGTPLYASLDAFGSRYSPNIFHNWKLGLADLMHQVSSLTNQAVTLDNLASPFPGPCGLDAGMLAEKLSEQRREFNRITLPDHRHVVKLDERIRRYHASLPEFLLLHKPLPIEMAGKVDEDELAQIICQRHVACSMVHRMLMALHRPWFLSALAGQSRLLKTDLPEPFRNLASTETGDQSSQSESDQSSSGPEASHASAEQPSPSAMFSLSAVLRSATWQTETYASATACAPPQALAWWQFTNNALAAAIVQATALLRLSCPLKANTSTLGKETPATQASHPSSHFHTQVRSDLDKNICSFQNVAKRCKLAAKALPFLQRVSSAIDLGICKSRGSVLSGQDALQSSVASEEACGTQLQSQSALSSSSTSTSVSDTAGQTSPENALESFPCNNSIDNIPSHRNSNSNFISNSNISNNNSISNTSNINSTSRRNIGADKNAQIHTNRDTPSTDPQLNPSSTSAAPRSGQQGHSSEARRASSAKSELEAIFGPIASGLELSSSVPDTPVKPLYRQSWEPIPVPPSMREGDDQISQLPPSDDAGSSSSSFGTFPRTPRSGSPQMNADVANGASAVTEEVKKTNAAAGAAGAGAAAEESSKKKQSSASDIVLECIRFWQPEMLATPAERRS